MTGSSAKSYQYFYYACQTYVKQGKQMCNTKLVRKEMLEDKVINCIQGEILGAENIEKLCKLVLEEYNSDQEKLKSTLDNVRGQLRHHKKRLSKLFDALESGKVDIDDLAPRIKEVKTKVDEMQQQETELGNFLSQKVIQQVDKAKVRRLVSNLKDTLNSGSFRQKRVFLCSMIKNLTIEGSNARLEYVWPVEGDGVLSIVTNGGSYRDRTYDTLVKSQVLYH